MDNALEAIQSLPSEYRDRIVVHCIPGDSDQLAKALDAALKCFSDLHKRNGQVLTNKQKHLSDTLGLIRSELAVELLRLEGFDLRAAKARGKAEVDKPKVGKPKKWSQPVV
ncbi:MAG: hypothetical protein V7629_14775 [Motiliproteus sp.]